jgi:rhodanese-related sulfurtransferase
MFKLFGRGPQSYRDSEPREIQEMLRAGTGAQLIDVRNKGEYAQGHLPGARLMPMGELERDAASLRADQPVILYCLSGARSARAARWLSAQGFADVRNMKGGIRRWQGEIAR